MAYRILGMAYQFFNEIKLDKRTKKIEVRITRFWRVVNPKFPDELINLDFLAIDAQVSTNKFF